MNGQAELERYLDRVVQAVYEAPQPRRVRQPIQQSLDRIALSAVRGGGQPINECNFEVSLNGAPPIKIKCNEPGRSLIRLPTAPRPLPLSIRVIPTSTKYWGTVGHFTLGNDGNLVLTAPAEFRPPQPVILPGLGEVISVTAVLSRVRDATSQVVQVLGQQIPERRRILLPERWIPAPWTARAVADAHYVGSPPVNGDLNVELKSFIPGTSDLVLEIAGITAPRLVAVSWPRTVMRREGAPPTPFLVYFHPTTAQNVEARFGGRHQGPPGSGFYVGPGLGTYPFGWDYLFFGLWRYLNYEGSPLFNPDFKGLPYQISTSAKGVVLVLPLNSFPAEVGAFLDAGVVQDILQEIQAFMFRRNRVFGPLPPLGRTALAAFSSGNDLVTAFLERNRNHPFSRDTLRELYMFDPNLRSVANWASQALRWASTTPKSKKKIRAYSAANHPQTYARLLGMRVPSVGPFVVESVDKLRTAIVIPDQVWLKKAQMEATRMGQMLALDDTKVHQLVSAMMLTDALRRSEL